MKCSKLEFAKRVALDLYRYLTSFSVPQQYGDKMVRLYGRYAFFFFW